MTICSLCFLTMYDFIYFPFWFVGLDLGSDWFSSWSCICLEAPYLNGKWYACIPNKCLQQKIGVLQSLTFTLALCTFKLDLTCRGLQYY